VPKLPERKRRDESEVDAVARPYTRMALCGLQAGLSWRDMRRMKFTHLMQFLYEWEDMQGSDVEEVVDATTADVMALTRM